ncbi:uncharacterized protein [Pagrus major]|uniref:uncharacterized protein n=1 Tax=Pagrus major TaxID=143350 RepID=UPI003CC8B332
MVEFRWIKMSLFLMLVLHFTAAVTGQLVSSVTVRVKDEVTLPCNNVMDGQNNCNSTTWVFSGSSSTSVVALVDLGRIDEDVKAKSDRLSVTKNCSLVIKNVTVEDVGRYDCQQYKPDIRQGPDSVVHLSVVSMTKHRDTDVVTLSCSVSTYGRCKHTVKWLYEGKEVKKDNQGVTTSQSSCSASVHVLTSHHIYKSRFKSLTCSVTDGNKEQQLFPFRLQSTGKKPGEETTTTTTTTTDDASTQGTTTKPATAKPTTTPTTWWWFVIVAVGVAVLIITVVALMRWRRTEGNKTQMEENTADPEDGLHYASVSYTRKTNSRARILGKDEDDDDDDDDAVTYTTLKTSSCSAGASADPSNLYATINKPRNKLS